MKSMVEYNKKGMGKVNDILNNKKKAEESQHYIMNIYIIDKDDYLHVEYNTFMKISLSYLYIVMSMEEFLDFKMVEKQVYELRLNSQQIENIIPYYNEVINANPKITEHSLFIDVLQPLHNVLKDFLEDEE